MLSGFEQYSRWVPLIIGSERKIVFIRNGDKVYHGDSEKLGIKTNISSDRQGGE